MRKNIALIGGLVGCLLVAALWYLVLWKPQTAALETARQQVVDAEDRETNLKLRLARLRRTKAQEPELRAELGQLTQAVPEEARLNELLREVDRVAASTGVTYASIAQAEPSGLRPNTANSLAVQISLTGGYDQVLNFVEELSRLPRLLVVDSLDLGGGAGEGGAVLLNVSISARTFISPAPSAAPPATGESGGADGETPTSTTIPPIPS